MKTLITAWIALVFISSAYAVETVTEKTEAKAKDAKREVVQKAHRADEFICEKTDKSCLAKKAKHRVNEGGEYVKDKTKEGVNIVDNDNDKGKAKKKVTVKKTKKKDNSNVD